MDYFSSSTIEFIKKTGTMEKLIGEKELDKNDLKTYQFCHLMEEYHGNAGSGICYALAHAAEE